MSAFPRTGFSAEGFLLLMKFSFKSNSCCCMLGFVELLNAHAAQ